MKIKIAVLTVCLFFIVFTFSACFANTNVDKSEEGLKEIASLCVQTLVSGNYKDTVGLFSTSLKMSTTEAVIEKAWGNFTANMGDFIGIGEITVRKTNSLDIVSIIAKYADNSAKITLTYNPSNKIDDFLLNYYSTEEPESNDVFNEKDISFGEYGIKGRLTIPTQLSKNMKGDIPVVILAHDLGSYDMDNTVEGTNEKPFKQMAHELASKGVAVFRYESRYYVYPELASLNSGNVTIKTELTDDLLSAIEAVKNEMSADSDNIYVCGYGVGATVCCAQKYPIKGIICIGSSPRRFENILYDRKERELDSIERYTEDYKNVILNSVSTCVDRVKALKEGDREEDLFGMTNGYWISLNRVESYGEINDISNVLFMHGANDLSYFVDNDYNCWKEKYEGTNGVSFKLYNNGDHYLMHEGIILQEAINDIATFVSN